MTADSHVHLFPDADTGRGWLTGAGIAEPRRDGTLAEYRTLMPDVDGFTALLHARAQTLLPDGDRTVDHDAVLHRIGSYNDWGLSALGGLPGAAVVVGVDPALMSEPVLRKEIARGAANGAAGVKFAPASSRLYLDDDRCLTAFDEATRHRLPVVVQSGRAGPAGDRGHPFGRPGELRPALDAVPGLRVVLAHFGEGYDDETIELGQRYEGAFADLSMRLTGIRDDADLAAVARLIRDFGADKVMFGSNYPIANPARAAAALRRLADHGVDVDAVGVTNWRRVFPSRGST